MTDLRQAAQQALEALEGLFGLPNQWESGGVAVWRLGGSDAPRQAITALRTSLEQQAEPVSQRSDGMPTSKTERDLRRMLCIARHGGSAYMDDGEASFCGDKYYRSIDYMRESIESIRQAWYDAGVKKLSGAQPEQQAEPVPEWPLIKNILAVFGLDAIAFVAEWKAAQQQAEPVEERITHITWDERGVRTVNGIPDDAPRRKELSASEILNMMPSAIPAEYDGPLMEFARAIEAAHNIKEVK